MLYAAVKCGYVGRHHKGEKDSACTFRAIFTLSFHKLHKYFDVVVAVAVVVVVIVIALKRNEADVCVSTYFAMNGNPTCNIVKTSIFIMHTHDMRVRTMTRRSCAE